MFPIFILFTCTMVKKSKIKRDYCIINFTVLLKLIAYFTVNRSTISTLLFLFIEKTEHYVQTPIKSIQREWKYGKTISLYYDFLTFLVKKNRYVNMIAGTTHHCFYINQN